MRATTLSSQPQFMWLARFGRLFDASAERGPVPQKCRSLVRPDTLKMP